MTPSRRTSIGPKKPRRWLCGHCRAKNDPGKRSCASCRIGRATKRTSLRTRADTLWAQYIKRNGTCQRCGLVGPVDAAHIIGRAQRSVRHDPVNGLALCRKCHRDFDSYRFDREAFICDVIGERAYAALRQRATVPWSRDYAATIAQLVAALRELDRS